MRDQAKRAVLTIDDPVTRSATDIPVVWWDGFDVDAAPIVPGHLRQRWHEVVTEMSAGHSWLTPYPGLPFAVHTSKAASTATGIYAIGSYLAFGKVRWKVPPPYPR